MNHETELTQAVATRIDANCPSINEAKRGTGPKSVTFDAFPCALVYWDVTLLPDTADHDKNVGNLTAINGQLYARENPRIAVVVYGRTQDEALDCHKEVKDTLLGYLPTITGVQVMIPLHPVLGVVPIEEDGGAISGIVSFFELEWEFSRPIN